MNGVLTPRVQVERCTRYRFRYGECARCAEACPHGAMQLSDAGVAIDAAACRDCGLCLGACPTEVFESQAFSRAALVRGALQGKAWTIACSPSGAAGEITLPCLGVLDAGTAAFLLSHGVQLTLAGLGHCAACAHGLKAADALAGLAAGIEHLRSELGGKGWGALTLADAGGEGVDRFGAGRRQFFRRVVAGGAARLMAGEAQQAAIPPTAVRAAVHYRPLFSELIDRLLGEREVESHPSVPIGRVAASGECTGCELCERVCPTGALRTRESESTWELAFHGHCVGCGVCVEACRPGALRLAARVGGPAAPERLHQLRRTRCKGCGRIHVGTEAEAPCPVCADDDRSFGTIFG